MPTEFRTSFLGFNRDDVLNYVHRKDFEMKAVAEKASGEISALKAMVEDLKSELNKAVELNSSLKTENDDIKARLDEFESQIDSINNTAEKIGKLYLVSKTSAKSIVDKAHESSVAISNETAKNLENIVVAQTALSDIKGRLLSSADDFVKELDSLNASLSVAKDKVESNSEEQVKISAEFSEIYEKLS